MNKLSMKALPLALGAVLLWSTLALFGSIMKTTPPFLMLGLVFSVGGLFSLIRREGWRVPALTLLIGTAGIFGYHFLYFRAFALAPAVEANLINYLWPLLIVLLAPLFLRGCRLGARHVAGGLLGLSGAVLILSSGSLTMRLPLLQPGYAQGYALAAGAAITWAVYSLLTKRLPPFPTSSVGAFCLLSALLSFGAHLVLGGSLLEARSLAPWQWPALLVMGLGPMGAAFFLWDAALKRGDPRAIGALAYLTPLLSTLILVLFGGQRVGWTAGAALVLIVAGALLGNSGG